MLWQRASFQSPCGVRMLIEYHIIGTPAGLPRGVVRTLFFAGTVHAKSMKQNDATRKKAEICRFIGKTSFLLFFCKKRRRPGLSPGLALMLIIPFLLFFLVLFPAEQYFLLQAVSLLSCTYIRICILLQRIRP